MNVRLLAAACIGLGVLVASFAGATAADVVKTTAEPIELDASKGALLRFDRPARTVFVADPEIADVQVKSPQFAYIIAKRPGETTIFAVDENDRLIVGRRISVSHNLSRLEEAIHNLLPDADITVRSVDGALVLSGRVETVAEAEDARRLAARMVKDEKKDIINRIAVEGPNQIQLRVRVAEVSRELLKQFGINWNAIVNAGNFTFGFFQGSPFSVPKPGQPFFSGDTSSVLGSFRNGDVSIDGLIDALDDEGLISVLAEPNLTAMSGETATFLAGGEFPILVAQGDNKISVQFKPFGVALSFLPTLTGENRINLHVAPEVSQLSSAGAAEFAGFSIPALTTRRAETTVELGSGQSFAIAGLLTNTTNKDLSEFPGLADLPVLGRLFQSEQFKRNESELVIIVTPYVVKPVSDKKLALPNDGLVPPNDVDRVLRGRNYRPNIGTAAATPQVDGGNLAGPAGFVLN